MSFEDHNSSMQWYAVRVTTGRESSALESLKSEISRQELSDYFGDILVPTEDIVDIRSGKKKSVKRKFLPGYMLVQMIKNDSTYQVVRKSPDIVGFVGGLSSRPLSQSDVDRLINRVKMSESGPRMKVQFHVGELVRVKDGPFADFNGAVEKIMAEKHRLVVSVFIFGRSTPVELEYSQVEKTS